MTTEDLEGNLMEPSPKEMQKQQKLFEQCNRRLAAIQDKGYDVRQDAIIAGALISFLFGPEGLKERNAFDVFATHFYVKALDEIDAKIKELQERQKQEYTRQQLLSGVKMADLRFPPNHKR